MFKFNYFVTRRQMFIPHSIITYKSRCCRLVDSFTSHPFELWFISYLRVSLPPFLGLALQDGLGYPMYPVVRVLGAAQRYGEEIRTKGLNQT